jgi:hypothetical protein
VSRRAAPVLLAAGALLAGCGGGGDSGGLVWDAEPWSGKPSKLLPNDHVVLGTIRNDSLRKLKVRYTDVRVLVSDGRTIPAAIRFTHAPGHGMYPPTREPAYVRDSEDLRIGRAADLPPGAKAPLVVAWTERRGAPRAAVLDYGAGRLRLP